MIEFFDVNPNSGYISIYDSHITINKDLMPYIIDAYRVRVGIDKENKELYIYPLSKDYALSGEIKESSMLSLSIAKSYARICSRALIEYICKAFNIKIEKKDFKKYLAEYDEAKKALKVHMED